MLRISTVLLLLFAASTVAFADGYDPPGSVPGFVQVANDAELQTELKLTDKEIAAAKEAADLLQRVRDGKAQEMAVKMIRSAFTEDHYKQVLHTFWRRLGRRALFESQVRKHLKLTSDQIDELAKAKTINDKKNDEMLDFMKRARFRSAEAIAAYKKKYSDAADERLFAVLTKAQFATFKALVAEKA